jgi:hypothetical protein
MELRLAAVGHCPQRQILFEITGFVLSIILAFVAKVGVQYAMVVTLIAIMRLKFLELELARQYVPALRGKSIAELISYMIRRDFTAWGTVPDFPFILGCLNSMSAVSQAIFVVEVMTDGEHFDDHRKFRMVGLNGLTMPHDLHMWKIVLVAVVMAHVWFLGFVFKPVDKSYHRVMLMDLLGLSGLRREYQDAGLYVPDDLSQEFWFTLDVTIVRTVGCAIPNLWFQQTRSMVHTAAGPDFVTTMSTALSILMILKQLLRLASVTEKYLKANFNKMYDSLACEINNLITWDRWFQMIATMILMCCICTAMAKRMVEARYLCPSHLWNSLDGCVS